jgi:hypothetical protein
MMEKPQKLMSMAAIAIRSWDALSPHSGAAMIKKPQELMSMAAIAIRSCKNGNV